MRRVWFLVAFSVLCVFVTCAYFFFWRAGEDVLVSSPASPGAPPIAGSSGRSLFSFGNPYLDGRSSWLTARFREAREVLRKTEVPGEPLVECNVLRAPFTTGPWLDSLDETLKRHRAETESQAVKSRLVFFVHDMRPIDLLLYFAASEFFERIPGEGTIDEENFFPFLEKKPEDLESLPRLEPNQWLSRLRWARPLAMPTATYYINAIFRDGDCLSFVHEAWRNIGGPDHAPVRLGSGQYAFVAREGGTVVQVGDYYSGQAIPPLMDGLAVGMTVEFYRKMARTVTEGVPGWKPPREVVGWFRSLGLE